LVDTPGFDDSRFTDDKIVKKILEWLRNSLAQGTTLNGIIYIHPIVKPRIGGTASSNIRMFKQLCGPEFYNNVVLATTFWEGFDPIVGKSRERELRENDEFWGILYKRGSSVVRLGLDDNEDRRLLLRIAKKEKLVLQAQREMQEGKDILDTAAAREVTEDVTKWSERFEQELRLEDEKCRRKLAEYEKRSRDRIEAHRQALEREREQRELSQKRVDYHLMKEQWLRRQSEEKARRDRRSAALQADIDQLQQKLAKARKRNSQRMERPYSKHHKCKRGSVPKVLFCSKDHCMRTIRPKRHRFYRKWHHCIIFSSPYYYLRTDKLGQIVVTAITMITITANIVARNAKTRTIPG
jgi:ribosomal protein L25 (general stress protein Ctc)